MPKLIKAYPLKLEYIVEDTAIVSSWKNAKEWKTERCDCCFRQKHNLKYFPAFHLCPENIMHCETCFYKAGNFLNVHKLIKKIRNEQANKLSKA